MAIFIIKFSEAQTLAIAQNIPGLAYLFIAVGAVVLATAAILALYYTFPRWWSGVTKTVRAIYHVTGLDNWHQNKTAIQVVKATGFAYDQSQDIFYSVEDTWQKPFGFCRLYDETTVAMGMIIDCEPVTFDYNGRHWLIEFWKGQYDLTTGCEVGVYNTEGPSLNIPGFFNGTFYHAVERPDYLRMTMTLYKNGKPMFTRTGRHWWLTGFSLGEFSQTRELVMHITLVMKDIAMRDAFVQALHQLGYTARQVVSQGLTVRVEYDQPYSQQPIGRDTVLETITQKKNELLCSQYREITEPYPRMSEKLETLARVSPQLSSLASHMGKPKESFSAYQVLQSHIKGGRS